MNEKPRNPIFFKPGQLIVDRISKTGRSYFGKIIERHGDFWIPATGENEWIVELEIDGDFARCVAHDDSLWLVTKPEAASTAEISPTSPPGS